MEKAQYFSMDAFKINYGHGICYVGKCKVSQLFSISKVVRADENPEKGFQRELGETRAKKIAEYLDSGMYIPGSIILSGQEGALSTYSEKTHKLKVRDKPGSFLVIDGQHRLYGASRSTKDFELPVCILSELSLEDEVQYFIDINGYQRGVPKTLRHELSKFTAEPGSMDERLNLIFSRFEESLESPLYGKMARTKSVSKKISHVAFRSAIKPVLESAFIEQFNFEQTQKVLLNYLVAFDDVLQENFDLEPRLNNAAFFQAVMGVFIDAAELTYLNHKSFKVPRFKKTLVSVNKLDYERHKGTNRQAINELTKVLKSLIGISRIISDDML